MKQILKVGLIFILISLLGVSGCSSSKKPSDANPQSQPAGTSNGRGPEENSGQGSQTPAGTAGAEAGNPSADPNSAGQPDSGDPNLIEDPAHPGNLEVDATEALLQKGSQHQEYSYDLHVTYGGTTLVSKCWVNGSRLRTEAQTGSPRAINLMNEAGVVSYLPDEKKGFVMSHEEYQGADDVSPLDYADAFRGASSYTLLGTDTYDGAACLVVEVFDSLGTYKGWINQGLGMFVKIESGTGSSALVVEFRNIKNGPGSAPEELFIIPDDIEVVLVG